jgi:succinoglycan biosynthesis protein ExoA
MKVAIVAVVASEPHDRLVRMFSSIAAQVPRHDLEVVVACPRCDAPVVTSAAQIADVDVRLVDNDSKNRSVGLNRAIAAVTSDVVVRVDARSVLPAGYVRRCIDRLDVDPSVGVVGGHQIPTSAGGFRADVVARALSNSLAMGGSAYRKSDANGSVDTVYLGAFRTSEIRRIRYDEQLVANEDFDVCQRFVQDGRIVWLEEGLDVAYEPRTSVRSVTRQYFDFGKAKSTYWFVRGERPNRRQVIGLLAPVVAVLGFAFLVVLGGIAPFIAYVGSAVALLVLDEIGVGRPGPVSVRLTASVLAATLVAAWFCGVLFRAIRLHVHPRLLVRYEVVESECTEPDPA